MLHRVRSFARDWPLHLTTIAFVALIAWRFPQQAWLLAYKATLILLAPIGVYWINRWLFRRNVECARDIHTQWQTTAMICAAMLAAGLAA